MHNPAEVLMGMIDKAEKSGKDSVYTIGNDILFLPDFYRMLNDVFVEKVYTKGEKEYANQFATPALRFASTFSAKEAVYKAVKQCHPKETLVFDKIEILRDRPAGKPSCTIHHSALNQLKIALSISHDGDYVWAIALVSV